IIAFSILGDHVHLVVEAAGRRRLSSGMRSITIRIARAINTALGRSGRAFADRFHQRALATPTEVRNALAYVLLNRLKHLQHHSPASAGGGEGCSRPAHRAARPGHRRRATSSPRTQARRAIDVADYDLPSSPAREASDVGGAETSLVT